MNERQLRLNVLAQLREGIPPDDSITIVCGRGTHRVIHDRTGTDVTSLIAYAGQFPATVNGIAMHEFELMRATISLLIGDHEVTFER